MIETLVGIKRTFEEKLQKEFKIMIIWDSIAATSCSKISDADDPNRIIGVTCNGAYSCELLEHPESYLYYNAA